MSHLGQVNEAVRALLADTTAAEQRGTLGLGTAAVANKDLGAAGVASLLLLGKLLWGMTFNQLDDVVSYNSAVALANLPGVMANATYDNGAGTLTASSNGSLASVFNGTLGLNDDLIVHFTGGTDAPKSGIYEVTTLGDGSTPGVLTRRTDLDAGGEFVAGKFAKETEGGTYYGISVGGSVTLGTTAISFVQLTPAAMVSTALEGLLGGTDGDALIGDGAGGVQHVSAAIAALLTAADASAARTALGVAGGFTIESTSTSITADDGDVVLMDASGGARTVTLPAVASGVRVRVKKVDSSGNAVTVSPASGTIDGAATDTISTQYDARDYVSDGTNWFQL